MSTKRWTLRRHKVRHTWPIPAIIAVFALIGGVASDLIASDLDHYLKHYRPVVWAVFGLGGIAAVVAAMRDNARPQPSPVIPPLPQLENVGTISVDAAGTITYIMQYGGQIIGRIAGSVIRRSALTGDPRCWEHTVTGEILNFADKPIVIRDMHVISEIDNEVLTHYSWRASDPHRIIQPNEKVDFSLVFWPLTPHCPPSYRFHLTYCLTKVLTETTAGSIEIPITFYHVDNPPAAVEAGILSKAEAQVPDGDDYTVLWSRRNRRDSGFGWKVLISVTRGAHPLRGALITYVVVSDARHVVAYEATTDDEGEWTHLDYALVDRLTLDVVLTRVKDRLLWIKRRHCVITKENPLGRIMAKL